MSIAKRILESFDEMGHKGNSPGHATYIKLHEQNVTIKATICDVDKYSAVISDLALSRDSRKRCSLEDLTKQAKSLESKINYLQEYLLLLELDERQMQAQLRSKNPLREKDVIAYYELMLTGGHSIVFHRYKNKAGQTHRGKSAFPLTKELFEKLIQDMAEALAENPEVASS